MNFKHPRRHDDKHLAFVRSLPCCLCGNDIETEVAHVREGNLYYGKKQAGLGEKPDDCWVVPLCGKHHRRQHEMNELKFWAHEGINPWILCQSLYAITGDSEMAMAVLDKQCGYRERMR